MAQFLEVWVKHSQRTAIFQPFDQKKIRICGINRGGVEFTPRNSMKFKKTCLKEVSTPEHPCFLNGNVIPR